MLVAICTTRTLTVTTKPVSAAVAPTIEARRTLAVDAEYSREPGTETRRAPTGSSNPSRAPVIPPSNGRNQRLPFRYWRVLKSSVHTAMRVIQRGERFAHIIPPG